MVPACAVVALLTAAWAAAALGMGVDGGGPSWLPSGPVAAAGALAAAGLLGGAVTPVAARPRVLLAAVVGLVGLAAGESGWLAAPLVAATAAGGPWAALAAVAAEALVPGAGRIGATAALAFAADRRAVAAAAGALVAAVGVGVLVGPPSAAGLDPLDLDAGGGARILVAGVAVLAAIGAAEGPGAAARAGLVLSLAFGPTLVLGGAAPTVGGRLVPLPGLLLDAIPGLGACWPLAVAALIGRAPVPRGGGPAAVALAASLLALGPPRTGPAAPPGGRLLATVAGPVLVLPPRAGAALPAPLPDRSALYADPLVVAALGILDPDLDVAVPPGRAGAVGAGAGVVAVVVDRRGAPREALVVLDGLLRGTLGPPVRDLRDGLDLYRVAVEPAGAGEAVLRAAADPLPDGWLPLDTWLAAHGR